VLDEGVAVERLALESAENHHFERAGEEIAALSFPGHVHHYRPSIPILRIGML
jgi:hypothetical protein